MSRVARYIGVFLLWNLAVSVALLTAPPLLGAALSLLLAGAVLWGFLLRAPREARRWAQLRLRPLDRHTAPWLAMAVPVLLLASWALGQVWIQLVPVPPESFNPFDRLTRTPMGRLSFTLLAIGVAPLLEELFFRGLIQHAMERRLGHARGIAAGAALFAAVHLLPWVFPLHFFLGMAFGYAVYLTRSIWAGVLLHAANNTAAVIGIGMQPSDPPRVPTVWESGPTDDWWLALAGLLLSLELGRRVARGLRDAGRLRPRRAGG